MKCLRFTLLVTLSLLYGCNSATVKTAAPATPPTHNNTSPYDHQVNDWLAFSKNADSFEAFEMGLTELIKRQRFTDIQQLWDIDATIEQLTQHHHTAPPSTSANTKATLEVTIKKLTDRFCSQGDASWHHIGSKKVSDTISEVFYRIIAHGKPRWCSFNVMKKNRQYRIVSSRNVSINYSLNDLFYDINNTSQTDSNSPPANASKTDRIIKIMLRPDHRQDRLLSMTEDELKDLGTLYLFWLIEHQQYQKAQRAANQLSQEIPDSYFKAYTNFWLSFEQGHYKKAIKHTYQGLQYAPSDMLLFYLLLEAAIADGNTQLATLTLDTLTHGFGYRLSASELKQLIGGTHFVQSQQYRRWQAGSTTL